MAASAVALQSFQLKGLADSKLLSERQREALFIQLVIQLKDFSYCACDHNVVDSINIRQATLKAMRQSYQVLSLRSALIIIDGVDAPIVGSIAQIKADRDIVAVSAASIIAKVMRDRMMLHYHQCYPLYRFDLHKGYPTALHRQLIAQHGLSPIHRKTYKVSVVHGA